MYKIISNIKIIAIDFSLLGVISCLMMIHIANLLDVFNETIINNSLFLSEISTLFIVFELILFLLSLAYNAKSRILSVINIAIYLIFALQIYIIYSIYSNIEISAIGIDMINIILLLELVKSLTILYNTTINTIEIFEIKNYSNNYKINHLEN